MIFSELIAKDACVQGARRHANELPVELHRYKGWPAVQNFLQVELFEAYRNEGALFGQGVLRVHQFYFQVIFILILINIFLEFTSEHPDVV